jgi:hypothetical protein
VSADLTTADLGSVEVACIAKTPTPAPADAFEVEFEVLEAPHDVDVVPRRLDLGGRANKPPWRRWFKPNPLPTDTQEWELIRVPLIPNLEEFGAAKATPTLLTSCARIKVSIVSQNGRQGDAPEPRCGSNHRLQLHNITNKCFRKIRPQKNGRPKLPETLPRTNRCECPQSASHREQ